MENPHDYGNLRVYIYICLYARLCVHLAYILYVFFQVPAGLAVKNSLRPVRCKEPPRGRGWQRESGWSWGPRDQGHLSLGGFQSEKYLYIYYISLYNSNTMVFP